MRSTLASSRELEPAFEACIRTALLRQRPSRFHAGLGTSAPRTGEAELVLIRTPDDSRSIAWGLGQLTPEELTRCQELVIREQRSRFVARRAFLNWIVAHRSAGRVRHHRRGRPLVDTPCDQWAVSTSSVSGWSLVALASTAAIGVDLVELQACDDALDVASRFFHPSDRQLLAQCPHRRRSTVFARLWAANEAIGKATGAGLAAAGELELGPLATDDMLRAGPWRIHLLRPKTDLVAAVAIPSS